MLKLPDWTLPSSRLQRAERAVQLGIAHIVANREGESAEGAFDRDRPVAGLERPRFIVTLVAGGEAEEVHLVVARDAFAGIVVHQARAADMPFIRTQYGD